MSFQNDFKKLILIIFLTFGFNSANAAVKKSTVCAALMQTTRFTLGQNSMVGPETLEALNRINLFYAHQFPLKRNHNPHTWAVNITSQSTPLKHYAMAGRLAGINHFRKSHFDTQMNQEVPENRRTVGLTLRGAEEINAFLELTNAFTESVAENVRRQDPANKIRQYGLLMHALGGTSMATTITALNVMGADLQFYLPLTLLALVLGPENFVRFGLSFDTNFNNFQQTALDFTKDHTRSEQWRFDSRNYWMPDLIVSELWNRGQVGIHALDQQVDEIETWLARIIKNRKKHASVYVSGTYVMVDRLLTIDPETNEPEMTFLMRFSDGQPNFQSNVESQFTDAAEQPYELAPITIPTGRRNTRR